MKTLLDLKIDFDELILDQDDDLYVSQWYCGTTVQDWIPYYPRNPKKARFALKERGGCYLSKDCARIDFEIDEYLNENYKKDNISPDFSRVMWPRMMGHGVPSGDKQEIKGAFKIHKSTKIINLTKDFEDEYIREILYQRNEQAYLKSSDFAEICFNKGFDGILYKPCTPITNILSPCNDPMLVLFEPKDKHRKLFCYYFINKEI